MAINSGQSNSDPTQMWFGNNPLKEVWVGDEKLWPADVLLAMGPEVYLTFETSIAENLGTQSLTGPTPTGTGGVINLGTAEYRDLTGDRFSNYQSSWANGATLMCWARTVSYRNTGFLDIVQRNSPSGAANELYITEWAEAHRWAAGVTTGGTWWPLDTPVFPGEKDRQWHHLAVTLTRNTATNATLRMYVDGVFQAEASRTVSQINFDASTEFHLAQSRASNNWTGNLDNVATFNRPLLDNEIKAIYDAQKPTRPFIPTIITLVLPDMEQGVAFSLQLAANFAVTSWTATGVPPGLALNSTTGVLSGTPSTITSGTMTVVANGANGQTAEMTYSWSVVSGLLSMFVPFDSNGDIEFYFPIQGFDARTSSSSPRNPAFTFSGMLVAGDNNVNTYWQALHGKEAVSESAFWNITTGNAMNTVARPTEIILSSTADFQYQLLLQIGSGNLNLVSRTTGSTTNLRTLSRTIGNGASVSVQRSGLSYTVYHNNVIVYTYTGTTSNAAAWFRTPGRAYTGITMYSTSGQRSTRVADFSFNETN